MMGDAMKTALSALFALICLAFIGLGGPVKAQTEVQTPPSEANQQAAVEGLSVEQRFADFKKRFEEQWKVRVGQLETERKALDALFKAAWYLGALVVTVAGGVIALAVGMTFFVGSSFEDIKKNATENARNAAMERSEETT